MKNKLTFIKLIPLFFALMITSVKAQVQWEKYAGNPVITKGPADMDIIAVGQPTCLIEDGIIKMWYVGVSPDMKARICYATSTDGISWTKYPTPVLDVGGAGEWDRGWLDTPEVVKAGNTYYMMYYGDTLKLPAEISSAMGMAYSNDGVSWVKSSQNPVFTKAGIGHWDATWVESAALIYDETEQMLNMYYNGMDTSTWKLQIGLATSPDGEDWTRYTGNPVIPFGNPGQPDDTWCGTPAVIYKDGKYELWYSGTAAKDYNPSIKGFTNVSICYATSGDGKNWNKSLENPLFDTHTEPYSQAIDSLGPWAADVIFDPDSNKYKMWYESLGGISFATASNTSTGKGKNNNHYAELKIYPNPFNHFVTVKAPVFLNNASLVIMNINGMIVMQKNRLNGFEFTVEKKGLANGIYIMLIKTGEKVLKGKLIVE